MPQVEDHPLRYALANELHARPFPFMKAPCTVAFIALKHKKPAVPQDRTLGFIHLVTLLDRYGAAHPTPDATHYYGQIGTNWVKWEQHTEFSTYTIFSEGLESRPCDDAGFALFPKDWLAEVPGQRVTSALIRVESGTARDHILARLGEWFVPESLAVSSVLDAGAVVASDFRIDPAGHQRFAIFADSATGARRIGRIVQRLCEIETYKAMSMLGFAMAREIGGQLNDLDAQLTELMGNMSYESAQAEETLHDLLTIASQLETLSAKMAYRFGATGAYRAIVNQRIEVLREVRFEGRQSFAEFMMRRYEPAMRTVTSAQGRLEAMGARSARAANLLRTRVDVERSAQNQALLTSMDRRADQQLHLQRTVEGLSVVAVSYYGVSLWGYLLYPLAEMLGISKGLMTSLITLPVIGLVWMGLKRVQRRAQSPK
jgi:uncharacterized membrane-anchored protein